MLAKEEKVELYLKSLDLQFFAGDEEAPGAEGEEQVKEPEVKEPEKKEPEDQKEPEGKTYTDKELNDLLKGKTAEGQKKLLKQLGFEDVETLQKSLAALKAYEDSKKTAEELAAEELANYKNKSKELENELTTTKAQLAAAKAGVKEDAIDDVIVLASKLVDDKTDYNKAIKSVLEKYPQFKNEVEESDVKKPKFSQGQHKQQEKLTEQDKWNAAAATMLPAFGKPKTK